MAALGAANSREAPRFAGTLSLCFYVSAYLYEIGEEMAYYIFIV